MSDAETIRALGPQSRDPIFFAEQVLGVRLNPAQQRWFKLCGVKGWEWVYRRVVHAAANQIGKTTGLAILVLWAAHCKMGIRNEDWDTWFSSQFKWYHLGPSHPQSLLVMKDMQALMDGTHTAQVDRETGRRRQVRWARSMFEEIKFDGAYPGFKLWNGSEIHFRTTAEKAKGIQGVVANGISIDEAAFEPDLNEVMDQAVKLRLVATQGPVWLVSTPDGINDYYEIVEGVRQDGHNTFHERVWEAPQRRWALVWSHISDNIGYGLTAEEVEFMEADVDPATKEQQLRGAFLMPQDAFFVPQENILKAWRTDLPEYVKPQNNHKYVIFWDPSSSNDPTVVVILDVTSKPYRGVYFKRWAPPLGVHALIEQMFALHSEWNTRDPRHQGFAPRAITGFDSTSMGGVIIRQLLERLSPKRGINFGGKVKKNALVNARMALNHGDIALPASWLRLQREILAYKEEDKGLVQDAVMAFIGAAQVAVQGYSGALSKPFNISYRSVGD